MLRPAAPVQLPRQVRAHGPLPAARRARGQAVRLGRRRDCAARGAALVQPLHEADPQEVHHSLVHLRCELRAAEPGRGGRDALRAAPADSRRRRGHWASMSSAAARTLLSRDTGSAGFRKERRAPQQADVGHVLEHIARECRLRIPPSAAAVGLPWNAHDPPLRRRAPGRGPAKQRLERRRARGVSVDEAKGPNQGGGLGARERRRGGGSRPPSDDHAHALHVGSPLAAGNGSDVVAAEAARLLAGPSFPDGGRRLPEHPGSRDRETLVPEFPGNLQTQVAAGGVVVVQDGASRPNARWQQVDLGRHDDFAAVAVAFTGRRAGRGTQRSCEVVTL